MWWGVGEVGLSLIFDKKVRADIDFYSEWEWSG